MSVRYCGRTFTADEIEWLRTLIGEDPTLTRADLSRLACRQFNWLKADGGLKQMSARVAMLRMHEDALIELPPPRCERPEARIHISRRTDPAEAVEQPAQALAPLDWRAVEKRSQSRLWNEYIQRYHYLGYKTLPGAQLRYFVYAAEQPLALLGFGAAAWQCAPRDRYIGWTHEQRKRNLHLIVNNARFLILPWVQSRNLASMILAQAAIGGSVTAIDRCCWRLSSKNRVSKAPATRRPTGSGSGKPRAGASSVLLESKACRSRIYGFIPWIAIFRIG
jgi:hypothetical protein